VSVRSEDLSSRFSGRRKLKTSATTRKRTTWPGDQSQDDDADSTAKKSA
jgi:hypothetical protein